MANRFPLINFTRNANRVTLETDVRVKHTDGKWYIQHHIKTCSITTEHDLMQYLQNFYSEAYFSLKLSMVDPKMKFLTGEPLFELDDDQRSEEERIRNIYERR